MLSYYIIICINILIIIIIMFIQITQQWNKNGFDEKTT
jgi:hypothetical protein